MHRRGLSVSFGIAVLLLAAIVTLSPKHVTCLKCYDCDNTDNKSQCISKGQQNSNMKETFECNESLAVNGKKAYCLWEITDECQPFVYKSKDDMVGNGGETSKKWFKGKCVYINPEEERMKKYLKCYWERKRLGHDLLHKKSGFQVIGRSIIKRVCHCDSDECNDADAKLCRNRPRYDIGNTCGPSCKQVSRDQLETPGLSDDDEEFRDSCPKAKRRLNESSNLELEPDPKERLFEDCGVDSNRIEPELAGGLTYRHPRLFGRYKDGVRGSAPAALQASGVGMLAGVSVVAVGWLSGG